MHVHHSKEALLSIGSNGSESQMSKHRSFFRRAFLFYTDPKAPGCLGSDYLASPLEEEPLQCTATVDVHSCKGTSGCVGNAGISAPIMIGMESVALMSVKLIATAFSSRCSYLLSVRKTLWVRHNVCRSHRNG